MKKIRKISIGKDFPNGSMHYLVGKTITLLDKQYTISEILLEKVEGEKLGYNVYVTGEEGTVLWKTIIDMPVHLENDLTFQ